MKFLHLGDLHIGKSIGEFDLIEDQWFILDQIISIAEKNQVEAFLIAGDIYDKSIPSEAAVKLFDHFICKLAGKGIKAFIITGNHDSDERINFGSSLFRASDIFISAKYDGRLQKYIWSDSEGNVNIYLMPFIKASQVRHFYPEETITNYDEAVRIVLKKSGIDPKERNVLVAHQFVVGKSSEPQLGGSESAATKSVGLVEKISADCFQDFDYVALGHIHSAQQVERQGIRYAGSPLKYSRDEAGNHKYVTIVDLGKKGGTEIKLVPLGPMRDLRHLRGRMEKLLAKENLTAPDDFIYATLTDEAVIDNAMGIFQQHYPNTVRIDYDNSHTKELKQTDISRIAADRTFREVAAEFYRQMYGCDMNEDERKLMEEVAREAGIVNEADEA